MINWCRTIRSNSRAHGGPYEPVGMQFVSEKKRDTRLGQKHIEPGWNLEHKNVSSGFTVNRCLFG